MKRVLATGAALVVAVGGMGLAQAQQPSGYKVNGGGQVILDSSQPTQGPGDTVAFTAQQTAGTAARGQFQYVERDSNQQTANVHGSVTCLRVEGQRAIIEGVITRGGESTFRIDIEDAGRSSQGEDIVTVTFPQESSDCEDDVTVDDDFRLARGNVTIHQPNGGSGR